MRTAKHVKDIKVKDPDTHEMIDISVFKHENGGMFALDASFIEQCCDEDEPCIPDPFSNNGIEDEITSLLLIYLN